MTWVGTLGTMHGKFWTSRQQYRIYIILQMGGHMVCLLLSKMHYLIFVKHFFCKHYFMIIIKPDKGLFNNMTRYPKIELSDDLSDEIWNYFRYEYYDFIHGHCPHRQIWQLLLCNIWRKDVWSIRYWCWTYCKATT